MTQKPTIYCDMDGVLCDFHGEICKLVGKKRKDWGQDDPGWEMQKMFTVAELALILGATEDPAFWATLPFPPSTPFHLIQYLHHSGKINLHILTTPSPQLGPVSAQIAGKAEWLHHSMLGYDDFIVSANKPAYASPKSLLIDDNDEACRFFAEAGGNCLCWPAPWNGGRHWTRGFVEENPDLNLAQQNGHAIIQSFVTYCDHAKETT